MGIWFVIRACGADLGDLNSWGHRLRNGLVATVIATASGFPRFVLYLSLPLVLLAAIGNYVLIPPFGGSGAAVATALCQAIGAMASIGVIYHLWAIMPPVGTLWRSAVISVLAYTAAVMWPAAGVLLLIKLACIGTAIPLAYLALREFTAEEIAQARSFLPWRVLPVTQHQKM